MKVELEIPLPFIHEMRFLHIVPVSLKGRTIGNIDHIVEEVEPGYYWCCVEVKKDKEQFVKGVMDG